VCMECGVYIYMSVSMCTCVGVCDCVCRVWVVCVCGILCQWCVYGYGVWCICVSGVCVWSGFGVYGCGWVSVCEDLE